VDIFARDARAMASMREGRLLITCMTSIFVSMASPYLHWALFALDFGASDPGKRVERTSPAVRAGGFQRQPFTNKKEAGFAACLLGKCLI